MKKLISLLSAVLLLFGAVSANATQTTAQPTDAPASQQAKQEIPSKPDSGPNVEQDKLTAAILNDPKNPMVWYNRAEASAASSNIDGALFDYSYALSLAHAPDLYLARANMLSSKERWSDVVVDCNSATAANYENETILLLRSNAYIQMGCYAEAMHDVQRGLVFSPYSVSLINTRGILHYKQGEFEKAVADYQTVLKTISNVGNVYFNLAESLYLLGRDEEAAKASEQAVALGGMPSTKENAQIAFQNVQKLFAFPSAEERLAASDSYRNQGIASYNSGDLTAAVSALEQAAMFYPEGGEAYYSLGYIYAQTDQYEKAAECFAFAAAIAPNNIAVYNKMVQSLMNLKREDEAKVVCDRAIELDPTNSSVYYNFGILLHFVLRNEDAMPYLDKALELDQNTALYYGGRGDTLVSLGRYEEAIEDYTKCLALDPTDEMAASAMEICKSMIAQNANTSAAPAKAPDQPTKKPTK